MLVTTGELLVERLFEITTKDNTIDRGTKVVCLDFSQNGICIDHIKAFILQLYFISHAKHFHIILEKH